VRTAAQRHLAFARGKVAEAKALAALMLKGYRPLARRYAAVGGEIDLIMARGRTIAFIEVKARPQMDVASEAIGARKRERFSRAARGLGGAQSLGDEPQLARRRRLRRAAALAAARCRRVRDEDVGRSE
jgi:Holliday junction resolvase-like predicted endonuclease